LIGLLRGDLDAITLRALEKDRSRRYSTPMELAAGIRRYLDNEPVLARAPRAVYRPHKYIRRHRLRVTLVSLSALLGVIFAVAQAVSQSVYEQKKTQADTAAAQADQARQQYEAAVNAAELNFHALGSSQASLDAMKAQVSGRKGALRHDHPCTLRRISQRKTGRGRPYQCSKAPDAGCMHL
jgi:hypothetical protein